MTLPITRIVDVSIMSSPKAIERVGFGTLNIITKEKGPITRPERYRIYPNLTSVSGDWDATTEAYKAAQTYFAQTPSASQVAISMRYEEAQPAEIFGGVVTTTIDEFKAVTDGAFVIKVDGGAVEVSGLDFSAATDLESVADIVATGLGATATCEFDGKRFLIKSVSIGDAATISFPTAPSAGTDVRKMLEVSSMEDGALIAQGLDGETISQSLANIQNVTGNSVYGFTFTKEVRDDVVINNEDSVLAAADWAESQVKIFFNTTNDLNVTNRAVTTDIASKLKAKSLRRTMTTFSSYPSQYPSCSAASRAFAWNTDASNSHYTLMFKPLPTITVESLTFNEAEALTDKNCCYVADTAGAYFFQNGSMANGIFIDEVHGLDALESDMEVDVANLLYQAQTKIPYTDGGVQRIIATMRGTLDRYVRNGFLTSGTIMDANGNPKFLPDGYEITFVPVSKVPSADKDIRSYNGISFTCIGSGAIHKVIISGSFNR